LLQARRIRARLTQGLLAERAATSQQWVSLVERGAVDLRLTDAERLFAAAGVSLHVQTAPGVLAATGDPDLVDLADMAAALEMFTEEYAYLWRRFEGVPYLVGGRLAALAQGLPVRPLWLDLVVAQPDVAAANGAMTWLNAVRWSDVNQDYTIYDCDLRTPLPRRFLLNSGLQLRVHLAPETAPAVVVAVDERMLPVVPLAELLSEDPDIAELARRWTAEN
jgi:transcriptional regulator with XRE-family HTH domain